MLRSKWLLQMLNKLFHCPRGTVNLPGLVLSDQMLVNCSGCFVITRNCLGQRLRPWYSLGSYVIPELHFRLNTFGKLSDYLFELCKIVQMHSGGDLAILAPL